MYLPGNNHYKQGSKQSHHPPKFPGAPCVSCAPSQNEP